MTQSFEHIIEGCRKGNNKSQEQLYRHCYPAMLKVCTLYSFNVDDAGVLYNEAMLKVFTGINQFKGDGNFMGWVRRIVVNTCIDNCRKRAKFAEKELKEEHESHAVSYPDVYNIISGKEIVQLLKQLPINTALVFNLYVMEGYKHEEVAQRLGITSGTSKWHLSEARRLLKNKLDSLLTKEFYLHAI